MSLHKTAVVGNGTDKIYNKHAKVLQPPPMSSCRTLVGSDIFTGRQQDKGHSGDSQGPEQLEQLQQAGVSIRSEKL